MQCLAGVAVASYSSLTVLPPSAIWISIFRRKFENSALVGVTWITCFRTDAYTGAGTVYYSCV